MKKGRLEAFSDGVFAIIITIMVLELKLPHGNSLEDLTPLIPVFISYILSFIYIGLYWNNHHHLFQAVEKINGRVLWSNMHLLFWLSLMPFATAWMGENHFSLWPVILYGVIILMASVSYHILVSTLLPLHNKTSPLTVAIGKDVKGKISMLIYMSGIAAAFLNPFIGLACYVIVAAMWLIPDKRIERNL